MSLLQRSLWAGAVIALTALLRAACRNRLPRRMYIALWDLAALRLLLPLSLPWAYAPRALLAARLSGGPRQTARAWQTVQAQQFAVAAVDAEQTVSEAPLLGAFALPWGKILWLGVALLLAAHFLRAYVVSLRAFGESLPDDSPEAAALLQGENLRRRVRVRVSGRIGAPLSYGILRPVILLPKGMDRSGDTLTHVLLHELAHIRALDAVRKLALVACLCVHWFNPFVYVMFLLANRDMELLCDARVLARLGRAARRDYAMTLLALEARRSELSPLASGFSITAIEERITAMKTMKTMRAASVLFAALLVLSAGVALATDAPKDAFITQTAVTAAGTGTESSDISISREAYEKYYAAYAPYGLTLDDSGRLMYAGKRVRYFEDMYPVGTEGMAGTVIQLPDGEVDVYAVRDLTGPIERNADGSFDPSGKLTGLRAATQAEFDARTTRSLRDDGQPTAIAQEAEAGTAALEAEDCVTEEAPVTAVTFLAEGGKMTASNPSIVWWTAEEYAAYVETQREEMAELVAEGAKAWTNTRGWFTWTQEVMDETMAIYEQTLRDIRNGAYVSKTVNGSDDVILHENLSGRTTYSVTTGEESVTFIITEDAQ